MSSSAERGKEIHASLTWVSSSHQEERGANEEDRREQGHGTGGFPVRLYLFKSDLCPQGHLY
jgi:hypothetical protein